MKDLNWPIYVKHWPVDDFRSLLNVFMTVLSPSRAIKTLFYFFLNQDVSCYISLSIT